MKQPMFFVANWKMHLSYNQALAWIKTHGQSLQKLAALKTIILCPSYDALSQIHEETKKSNVALGAQNCAAEISGAYTGQVSAQSLKEIGCSYCIIGHSEQIKYTHETIAITRKKLECALMCNLIPILCIGETEQEYKADQTLAVLDRQLNTLLTQHKKQPSKIIIAYEPHWAIGSDKIPSLPELQAIGTSLREWSQELMPESTISILYGGSVDVRSAQLINELGLFDGYLIGRASLDFQIFEKIVVLE